MTQSFDFLETEKLLELINRISRAAAAPVAIHVIEENAVLKKALGTEPFCACAFVQSCPKGREACYSDLQRAARLASRNRVLTPFICHMGFACVCFALPFQDRLLLVTIGPYCPTEGKQTLIPDVRKGLWNIGLDPSETEKLVESIHVTTPSSIEEIAHWFVESLTEGFLCQPNSKPQCDIVVDTSSRQHSQRAHTSEYRQGFFYKELLVLVEIGDMKGLENALRPWIVQQTARTLAIPHDYSNLFTSLKLIGQLTDEFYKNGLVWQRSLSEFSSLITKFSYSNKDSLTGLLIDYVTAFVPVCPKEPNWGTLMLRLRKELDSELNESLIVDLFGVKEHIEITDFSRKLKQRLGLTLKDFLNVLKLTKARRLLLKSDLNNEEIALRIGFSSAMAFNRFFVRCTGITPKEYRRLGKGIR